MESVSVASITIIGIVYIKTRMKFIRTISVKTQQSSGVFFKQKRYRDAGAFRYDSDFNARTALTAARCNAVRNAWCWADLSYRSCNYSLPSVCLSVCLSLLASPSRTGIQVQRCVVLIRVVCDGYATTLVLPSLTLNN